MNHFINDWSQAEYHDQSKVLKPAFSYSTAKVIYQKSPKHAYLNHAKLGGQKRDSSASMDFGSAIHTALLGTGKQFIKSEYDDFRTKEAKAWRDEHAANGMIVLKPDEYDKIETIGKEFESQMRACGLWDVFASSQKELIAEYMYNDIYTISMLDAFNGEYGIIFDVKSTTDASPDACQRKIIDMGYDIQDALYTKSVEIIKPELIGKVRFIFLFQEVEPPFCMTAMELDTIFQAVGEAKVNQAACRWAECLATNQWPGYSLNIVTMECPTWHQKRVLENQ